MPPSILVVEDHPDVRNVLIEALTEAGGYAAMRLTALAASVRPGR